MAVPAHAGSTQRLACGRRVILAGATGLVGGCLLGRLLEDDNVSEVHALGRRAPSVTHPKLLVQRVDFGAMPPLPAADEVYLALGTTMRQAGSRAAFRAVERTAARLSHHLGHLIPVAWRPIDADRVAAALLALAPSARGRRMLGSAELQDAGGASSSSFSC